MLTPTLTEEQKLEPVFVRAVVVDDNSPYTVPAGHYGLIKNVSGFDTGNYISLNGNNFIYFTYQSNYQTGVPNEAIRVGAGDAISVADQYTYLVLEEWTYE